MKPKKVAAEIVAHIRTHGSQSRKMLEDAIGVEESTIRRNIRALLKQEPKPIYKDRWEVSWLNGRKYVSAYYALGDNPCVPHPANGSPLKPKRKYVPDAPVHQHDTRADALLEAMAGWHHNTAAPPWNTHIPRSGVLLWHSVKKGMRKDR